MANPLSPLPHPYAGVASRTDDPTHRPARRRNARRLLAMVGRAAIAVARAVCALLTAAGPETALLIGADSTWVLPFEREAQGARRPPARVTKAPDLHAVIGELLYPGYPGAVVRFTAAMAGTDLMANY